MRSRSLLLLPAVAGLVGAATEPVALQQTSPWVVDYGDQSCRLIGTFGTAGTKLIFQTIAPGTMTAMVIGKDVRAPSDLPAAGKLRSAYTVRFPGQTERTLDGTPAIRWAHVPVLEFDEHSPPKSLWTTDEKPSPPGSVRPPPINEAQRATLRSQRDAILASSDGFEIDPPGKPPVMLETGTLTAPVHALDQCNNNLLKDLGVDPDAQARLARPPWTNKLLTWITPDIYPRSAMGAGIESSVMLRLIIDASGKATNCTAVSSFAAPEFGQAVCGALAKRAIFEPAELADGTKVPSYFVSEVTFRLAD